MTNHWSGADGSTATIPNVATPEVSPQPKSAVSLYFRPSSLPFWAIHVAALAGIAYTGWSWKGAVLAVITYFVRMIDGVTAHSKPVIG